MRNIAKKLRAFCCIAVLAAAVGCEYDDTDLKNSVGDLTDRVEALETRIKALNGDVEAVQKIVEALQKNVYVAKVESVENGYRITFTDGRSIEIANGRDGANGADGADAPVIGVKQDTDGVYYWTITAEGKTDWLRGADGAKLPVTGVTPVLSVDAEGFWTVSYDGGRSFSRILDAEGNPVVALQDSTIFDKVTEDEDNVYFTLADGTVITVAKRASLYMLLKDAPETAEFAFGETKTFEVEAVGVSRVTVTKPDEWRAAYADGKLTVTAPSTEHELCAELAGEVSLIYFNDNKQSDVLTLKVEVRKPVTFQITVLETGLENIKAEVVPSDDETLYYVTQFRTASFEDGDNKEEIFAQMLGGFNMFVESQGWEAAERVLCFTGRQIYEGKWLYSNSEYKVCAFGVAPETVDGKVVAVATTDIFFSEPARTAAETIDLSASGTANSYIVTEPSTRYKFKATVQGNGKATTGITPAAIDPKFVFVAWETGSEAGNVIKDVTLESDGYISFTTGETVNGNALIAVTDNVASEEYPHGTILWSWHIWANSNVTDITCINAEQKSYTLMNCNLGDWEQPEGTISYSGYWGLKYQWGRKDPFVGFSYSGLIGNACVPEASVDAEYPWEADYGTYYAQTAEEVLQLSINFPKFFIKGNYATDNDWYGVSTGGENRNNNFWGNGAAGEAPVKTIYDPCPVGYMVAPLDAFSGFFKTGLTTTTIYSTDLNVEGAFDKGWKFLADGTSTIFMGAAGSMNYSSGVSRNASMTGYYWTSTPSDGISTASQVRSMRVERTMCQIGTGNRAEGMSVRCVRE